MTEFLADTSIWAWAVARPSVRAKLMERVGGGEVATCVPVALEYLHGARDGAEYEANHARFRNLGWYSVTASAARRALALQRELAGTTHGAHRISSMDYLVAAVAEAADVVLWHADRDLARLCEHTGQPHEHERVGRR